MSKCKSRVDVLKTIIELCPTPSSPKELYIVSKAYVWLGAGYRKQAIKYLNKYISAGAIWEGTPCDTVDTFGYETNQKESNIASIYYDLGQCYEKEYIFDKAIEAYKKASEYDKYFATYIVCISNVYVKIGKYDSALNELYNAKSSKYYRVYYSKIYPDIINKNDDYIYLIDKAICDIETKRKRGYKYQPRKQK